MTVRFREAVLADLPEIIALLRDDRLGQGREDAHLAPYQAAFEAMTREPHNTTLVGEMDGRGIVATSQLVFLSGLSLTGARRAQVESVRVASDLRGQGIGAQMFEEIERRSRAAGCTLIQLTMNASRSDSARFYGALGFTPSHIGYKRDLV